MRNLLIIGIGILIIGGGIWYVAGNRQNNTLEKPAITSPLQQNSLQKKDQRNVITANQEGVSPASITIMMGEGVTFRNEGSEPFWPASAVHPAHTVYPGSDIKKCGTPEESSLFDSCRGLQQGEEWTFTFTKKGTWGYHDHLNPSRNGTVVVE